MSKGLYYYKLVSPYEEDQTLNCKLTVNQIDSNFLTLKDNDIKSAEFIRDSKTLVLTRNNGEKLIVDLSDVTYDLDVRTECSESGNTLTISYDGKGGQKTIVFDKIVTVDNLKSIIGDDILTKVITDGTIKGDGTIDSPLGINGIEKTGMYGPVKAKVDLTGGGSLPEIAKLGTRYATVEYLNDYGYLYNGAGLAKIEANLEEEGNGWRVPTKADWDALLNSVEPCEYQNHNSSRCNVELGKYAGKYFKSECGWVGQPDCECTVTKPMAGCSTDGLADDEGSTANQESYYGVDKYGLGILPSGMVVLDSYGRPEANLFKEQALFWTSSHIYGDAGQYRYIKKFVFNKGGVVQDTECSDTFYSVRLVKDYDGSNYFGSEYIDGVAYNTILFPESGQIWLATNYAKKEGFNFATSGNEPEIALVNNGEIIEKRKVLFLNEWNGEYWDKKLLKEGDTLVIESPCVDTDVESRIEYCWKVDEFEEECDTLVISHSSQNNGEYRVFTTDGCNQDLVNTDDLVVERVIREILPILIKEKEDRIFADAELSGAIETEKEERIAADEALEERINEISDEVSSGITQIREDLDNEIERAVAEEQRIEAKLDQEIEDRLFGDIELSGAIETEKEDRILRDEILEAKIEEEEERAISAETALDEKIDDETERAISAETVLDEKIDTEIERAENREDEIEGQLVDTSKTYTISATTYGENNAIIESKDGDPTHFILINFDGDYGQI